MINNVSLTGRLTRDVELKYTQSGTAVASFTMAVDRQFTNAQGEREADFISCVIWRKSAENFSNFTHKGSLVGVEGHIQTRTYDNAQGQRVYVTEVVVENFALLESKNATSGQQTSPAASASQSTPKFGGTSNSTQSQTKPAQSQFGMGANAVKPRPTATSVGADPFKSNGQPIDISDEDLPF